MILLPSVEQKLSNIEVSEKFVHPYDQESWYWQLFFRTKRFIFLFAVFLPCVTVAGLGKITGSEELRTKSLDLLTAALNAAGCGVQKFGQWLSMRPDMVPPDVIETLAAFQQDVPAHHIKHTRKMVLESFGSELEEVFEEFDEKPVASGTVAQVHRGRLREDYAIKANIRGPDGELIRDVAVKVRHPDVLAEMWCDLEMIYDVMSKTNLFTFPMKKDELIENLRRQIDFKWEAHNLIRFGHNFESETSKGELCFPIVSTDMISPCVLLESWAHGNTVSNIFENVGEGFKVVENATKKAIHKVDEFKDELADKVAHKKRAMASRLFDMSIKMFLRDNLVHGDLHGGNVLVSEDGNCTVLDAGLTTSLEDDEVRREFTKFLKAICLADADQMVRGLVSFHVPPSKKSNPLSSFNLPLPSSSPSLSSDDPEQQALARANLAADVQSAVNTFVRPDMRAPDGNPICIGDIIGEVFFSMQRNGVCLRGDVASALMTMSLTEGLIRSLDPQFDIVKEAMPYFVRYADWSL